MKNYPIDKELKKYCRDVPFFSAMLTFSYPFLRLMYRFTSIEKGIFYEKKFIKTKGGRLRLDIFSPENGNDDIPVLFYLHGGGFGYFASPFHKKLAAVYAKEAHCRVICPDYRLLPKCGYPCAKNDSLEAYAWARKTFPHSRFAVGGDSAGGALAIYVVNEAEVTPDFQMLIYPVCDPRQDTPSMKKYTDTPFWNSVNNKKMWNMYAGKYAFDEVSPFETKLPEKIPDAYVELAQFDCLHDEGKNYAEKLVAAGANVFLNDTKGTVHGYDIALKTDIVKKNVKKRTDALKTAFSQILPVEK